MRKYLFLIGLVAVMACPTPQPPPPPVDTTVVDTTVIPPVDTTVITPPPPPSGPPIVVTFGVNAYLVSGTVTEFGKIVPVSPIHIIPTFKNASTVYGATDINGKFSIDMTGSVNGQYKVCVLVRSEQTCSPTLVSIPAF